MTHSGIRGDGTYQTYTFDAANRRKVFYSHQKVTSGRFLYGTYSVNRTNEYDGDEHPLKTTEVTMNIPEWQNELTIVKYQLWSTVLGGYITALKDDGAKETTKVYAGGAVIAEQVTRYGNEVYWIHADPVTGSSTKTTKTGAEYTRKEYEPFGQEVSTFEPEEEFPAPEGNADNLVDANDPHWQCQMADAIGTDFNIRPVHCQRSAQLAGISNADIYAEILGHQEAQRKRIEKKAHGMPANATPTDKRQTEAGGRDANGHLGENGSAVPKASTPNRGVDAGCTYGTDGSNNNCVVYASMIDMDETPGADSLQDVPSSPYPAETLKPKVDKILSDENCVNKLNQLLTKLKSKIKDIETLADKVLYSKDNFRLKITNKAVEGGDQGSTLDDGKTHSIVLNRKHFGSHQEKVTFFHEIFHTSKKHSHKAIANAIAEIEGFSPEWKNYLMNIKPPKGRSKKKAKEDARSGLLNNWLREYCVGGSVWRRNILDELGVD